MFNRLFQNLRHPSARKAAQRQSARRMTSGRYSSTQSSGARPFIQQGGIKGPRTEIRKIFVHSPNYHRVRKIKAPPIE